MGFEFGLTGWIAICALVGGGRLNRFGIGRETGQDVVKRRSRYTRYVRCRTIQVSLFLPRHDSRSSSS